MPDRGRARLAQMRLRAAARRPRWRRSPRPAGAFSFICGRRGGASAWSTSCGPMRCRTRASTRSTPIIGSASQRRRARFRGGGADAGKLLGAATIRLLTNNPQEGGGAGGGRDRGGRARAAEGWRPAPTTRPISTPSATAAATSSRPRQRPRPRRNCGRCGGRRAPAAARHGRAGSGGRRRGRSLRRPRRARLRRRPANPR